MSKHYYYLLLCILFGFSTIVQAGGCPELTSGNVQVQVLGSGGPELNDQRASSSYLIWHDGKAKLLVDVGSGSLFNFEKTGANLNDIEAIMLSHLHVDHTADLPALVKASFFTNRKKNLSIWGPSGNTLMPATTEFIDSLFGKKGAYRYLSSYIDGSDDYQLKPYNIYINRLQTTTASKQVNYQLTAVPVHHGPIPALAWQVTIGGKKIVFSGDMNHDFKTLTHLAHKADLFIAHHAVPETATGVAKHLHMRPSTIGQIAQRANVKQLVLSHHMLRTANQFEVSQKIINQSFDGTIYFAEDLQCYQP